MHFSETKISHLKFVGRYRIFVRHNHILLMSPFIPECKCNIYCVNPHEREHSIAELADDLTMRHITIGLDRIKENFDLTKDEFTEIKDYSKERMLENFERRSGYDRREYWKLLGWITANA